MILILIVEDNSKNVFALTAVLKAKGFQSVVAENGKEALKILAETDGIKVILMDIMMPVMDGYEAMRKMKENRVTADIPVIAVTARAMKGDREKCLEAGASDYISKPVNLKELLEKIERLISVSKKQ